MKKTILTCLTVLAIAFNVSLTGCSGSGSTSVTEGVEQSEIEAWKEKERQIDAEAAESMELE